MLWGGNSLSNLMLDHAELAMGRVYSRGIQILLTHGQATKPETPQGKWQMQTSNKDVLHLKHNSSTPSVTTKKASSSSTKENLQRVSFHRKLERGSHFQLVAKLMKLNMESNPQEEDTTAIKLSLDLPFCLKVGHLLESNRSGGPRDQTPPDSTTGPSTQPDDDTSEKVIHESSSTSDSERTESDTETAAPKDDKDQGEVDSSTVTSGVSIPVSDPVKAHEALAGPDPEPMKEDQTGIDSENYMCLLWTKTMSKWMRILPQPTQRFMKT
ncbi:hypothetical protein Tco_0241110 [Tanacetum coccineum]